GARAFSLIAALAGVVVSASMAEAGWVTLRNDSKDVLIIQETVTANGTPRRCKPVRLRPGEAVREFHPNGSSVKLEIFNEKAQTQSLYSGTRTTADRDQTFSITSDGKTTKVAPFMRQAPNNRPAPNPVPLPNTQPT